jgi:pimeloyl-ACP methyl ester carboxylesterase
VKRVTRQTVELHLAAASYRLTYFDRRGTGPTVLFVHGLGNAAANFEELASEPALAQHRLVAMDLPGCGDSPYPSAAGLQIDDLVDLVDAFATELRLPKCLLVGASMGGLIGLLYAERRPERVAGFVNVEGNLAPEDCMFSRLVIPHDFQHFAEVVLPEIKASLRGRAGRGFAKHLEVLEIAQPQAYYDYSFQTVAYSDHGRLLDRFLALPVARSFVYGSANRSLSYLPRLRESDCTVIEIPNADHFVFYDAPADFAVALAACSATRG